MSTPTSGRMSLAVVVGLAVVVAAALTFGVMNVAHAGTVSVLPVSSQQTGITVCGHGTAHVRPDQARIQVGVQASAATAEDARAQAAQAMNAVLATLKSNGVADQDIQTDYFAIQPEYSYSSGAPHQIGYSATNDVTATIRHIDNTGKIVDAVTAAGGNNVTVSGIQLSSGDPSQAQTDARRAALNDAHSQAQQIADGAGIRLGAPISINVGGCGDTQRVIGYAQAGAAPSSTTPVQPGQQSVDAYVAVVYAIG
jgi:uncharacterized protein